jgi:hypothetical protein
MAKVTVYIPDDLLERARELPQGEKTSQLVQRGLQRLLEDETRPETPQYARPPEGWIGDVLELRSRLIAEAELDYQKGFAEALRVARTTPLWSLNVLAEGRFDVKDWVKMNGVSAPASDEQAQKLAQDDVLPEELDDIVDGWIYTATDARLKGAADAFREVWLAVEQPAKSPAVATEWIDESFQEAGGLVPPKEGGGAADEM